MNKSIANYCFAFLLTLPIIVFFLSYWFNHSPDLIPTGFIQYDNAGYLAYGKQYLDEDSFHLFYSNPFNDSGNYNKIYFQIQSLLFAIAIKAGIPSVLILPLFTIICSFLCFRILIKIIDFLLPSNKYRVISIIFFAWGGGLLFIADIPVQLIYPHIKQLLGNKPLILDPGSGWWGLNFGRSLFFSCEAFYHLLFVSTILSVLKAKWIRSLLLLFLLSSSHPFSGVEEVVWFRFVQSWI